MAESTADRSPLIKGNSQATGNTNSKGKSHLPGRPPSCKFVTLCILVTELCERLTFYGITANLVPFCKDVLGMDRTAPTTVNLVFSGKCLLSVLFQ